MDLLERTLAEIRSKAAELRNSFGDEERARAIEWAASLVERALHEQAEERRPAEASPGRASQDHLARLTADGCPTLDGHTRQESAQQTSPAGDPGKTMWLSVRARASMIPLPTLGPLEADGEERRPWRLETGGTNGTKCMEGGRAH
jgi:hypothetical protein